ncbi:MAG: hypothetical protein FWD63_03545 [Propionibacteriaceae bacterium]|nr:hypothetical protein [Propionibacteriaceae bacterium]
MTAVLVERVAVDTSIGEVARVASHYRAGRRRPMRPVSACQVAMARSQRRVGALELWRRAGRTVFGIVYLGGLTVLIWTVLDSIFPVYQLAALS